MITNIRQYIITREQAARFREAIDDLNAEEAVRSDTHPRLLQAEREAMESQLADLQAELEQYEGTKLTQHQFIERSG